LLTFFGSFYIWDIDTLSEEKMVKKSLSLLVSSTVYPMFLFPGSFRELCFIVFY
jgi:hypothetical protein